MPVFKKTRAKKTQPGAAASQVRQRVSAMKVSRGEGGGLEISAQAGYDITSDGRTVKTRNLTVAGGDRHQDKTTRWQLMSISRHLDRNSLLSAMLDRWVDGTIGATINFRPQTADPGWNTAAHELIGERMHSCDRRGFFDLASLCRAMLRAIGTDGEQLWTMDSDGLIQAVETHQLGTPRDAMGAGKTIVDGVVVDAAGKPQGFWVSDEVYGGYVSSKNKAQYVSAAECIFPAYRKRYSQTHGTPLVASALKLYDRVDGYIDNEALAAEIDACLTFFVQRDLEATDSSGRGTQTATDGTVKTLQKIEPGMIARLGPGETVDAFGAKRPGQQFTPFCEMGLTMVGATVGVPLTLALLDFKKLNYSNARTLLLQMWQTWQIWHRCTVVPCLRWAYQRWIVKAIAAGELTQRPDALAVKFLPRRWPWVDPLKEIQALHDEIALGVGTLTDQLELMGYTRAEYLAERSAELKDYAAAGVPTTSIAALPALKTEGRGAKGEERNGEEGNGEEGNGEEGNGEEGNGEEEEEDDQETIEEEPT